MARYSDLFCWIGSFRVSQACVRCVGSDVRYQHQDDVGQAEDHAETLDQDVVTCLHTLHDKGRKTVITEINLDHDHASNEVGEVKRNHIYNWANGIQKRMAEYYALTWNAFQDRHLDIWRAHHIQHSGAAHPDQLRGDDKTKGGDWQRKMRDQLKQALALCRADDNGVADEIPSDNVRLHLPPEKCCVYHENKLVQYY